MEMSIKLHAAATLLSGVGPAVPGEQEAKWAPEPVWALWRGE